MGEIKSNVDKIKYFSLKAQATTHFQNFLPILGRDAKEEL